MLFGLDIYILFAYVFLFSSIFLGVYVLAPKKRLLDEEMEFAPLIHRGALGSKREELKEQYPIYRLFLPLITMVGFFISKLPLEGMRNNIRKRLLQAGNPGAFTPDEFLAVHIISMLLFPIFILFIGTALLGHIPVFILIIAAAFGFIYPRIWLQDTVGKRLKKINRSLPYTLDLITLSIEAGLDFISSVERIVTKRESRGPLAEELYQMLQELKMGKTRKEALRDMARRVDLPNLNSVVAALIQAEQLGTSLGPVLRIQAEMLRVRRSQAAEKAAMKAPVKLIFPLLLIFSAVFLMLVGPIVIRFLRGEIL